MAMETPELVNKSVVKAMALLTELGRHPQGASATELGQALRMSRPTAFRLLLSLAQSGFVEKQGGNYRLGWKLARLGRLADPHGGVIAAIQPLLEDLAEQLNEMVGYAVVNGEGDFDLVAEAQAARLISLSNGYVGREFPVHASATGKMVLAEMSDAAVKALLPKRLPRLTDATITDRDMLIAGLALVRENGWSTIIDELEDSLFSLAVPVRDRAGTLIGVLSVSGPSQRMQRRPAEHYAAVLGSGAAAISARLAEL